MPLEGGHDDRERGGREQRRAETLTRPSGEESLRRAGHRGRERRDREDREAGQEHPTPTEEIGGAASEEEQAAENKRVARDRPADVGAGQMKVTGEARQRDVHGGDVEDHHQLGDEEHEQEQAVLLARVIVVMAKTMGRS